MASWPPLYFARLEGERPRQGPEEVEGVGSMVRDAPAAADDRVQIPGILSRVILDLLLVRHSDALDPFGPHGVAKPNE